MPLVNMKPLLRDAMDNGYAVAAFNLVDYNTTKAMRWYWDQYAPGGTSSELVIPTKADSLAGLPPALVATAELDPPCAAGEDYARRLADEGVPVIAHRFDGLFHGFLTFPSLSLTASAREELWTLMRRVLDGQVTS